MTVLEHTDSTTAASREALAVVDLAKSYNQTRALKGVSFSLEHGKIHGLVGGNGSGKSTLVKILAGVVTSDPGGQIRIHGQEVPAPAMTSDLAKRMGLRFVHQDLGLFPAMTIVDNLALGHGYHTGVGGRIRDRFERVRAQQLLDRYEIDADADSPLGQVSAATRTLIAIARALQGQDDSSDGILVLDEPTAALPKTESDALLLSVGRLAKHGHTTIFISHRLDEVLAVSDTVTALRDGSFVGSAEAAELDEPRLVEWIIGRPLGTVYPQSPASSAAAPMLEVSDLVGGPLRGASLSVAAGEIVGIAGLLGSGRSTLLRTIFGDLPRSAGTIRVGGAETHFRQPRDAIKSGIAFVPEDRAGDAAFIDFPIYENVSAASIGDFFIRGRMTRRCERSDSARLIDDLGIKAHSPDQLLSALSGGNQQKVILARWLRRHPRLLLLDEPTQGVDVGARADIYELVRRAVGHGAAVLLVASDFEELALVSDRVLVLRDGKVDADLSGSELEAQKVEQSIYSNETDRK